MTTAPLSPRRETWTRVVMSIVALPLAATLVAAAVGAGNLPLGGLVAVPLVYLLVVLVLDFKAAQSGNYRSRPRYLLWWLLAVLPPCAWLAWLWLCAKP